MTEIETMIRARLDRRYPVPTSEPDWDGVVQRAARTKATSLTRADRDATRRGFGRRIAFVVAAVLAVAALSLLVANPWNSRIDIVQRANAALDIKPGTVLYESTRRVQTDSSDRRRTVSGMETWRGSDGSFRALVTPRWGGPRVEIGTGPASRIVPSSYDPKTNTIQEACSVLRPTADPVAALRKALASRAVRVDGTTTINDRAVDRIRTDANGARYTLYIDPHTYLPVETISTYEFKGHPIRDVSRFTFDRLPATEANLRLTSLTAEHPNAKINALGLPCYG